MKRYKAIASITTILALTCSTLAADDGAPGVDAKALEKQALGYWAPDEEAMLKVFTEKEDMKEEQARAMLAETANFTVHVEQGKVNLFSKQGKVSVPYEILKANKATGSLTLQAVAPPEAPPSEPVKILIKEDQITAAMGPVPFVLKRIDEAGFKKRVAAVPDAEVGP